MYSIHLFMHLFMYFFFCHLWNEIESNDAGAVILVDNVPHTLPIIPPRYLDFLKKRQKLYFEIRNMAILSGHSNIIKFHEVLEWINLKGEESTFYIVQELAEGGNLCDYLKNNRKSINGACQPNQGTEDFGFGRREYVARKFFSQILMGLKHCHGKGMYVVHCAIYTIYD